MIILFFFGKTVPPAKSGQKPAETASVHEKFDFNTILTGEKGKLTPDRQAYVHSLENSVVRGDVKNQQLHAYHQLASFWKDTVKSLYPYIFYSAEASKLENSEKSLTFAAQLFLDNLRREADPAVKGWMAGEARALFERSLQINPSNDSAKIGLGSSYIFGSGADDPQDIMKGIQQILEVVRRDSTNMYGQLMLGIGGVLSGQTDKAIERLLKVTEAQPKNLEAVLALAEAYEREGKKENAIKWYSYGKQFIGNPEIIKEIDQRIESLR